MKLRYYQEDAIKAILSNNNGIICLATGTGKSIVIAEAIKQINGNCLILQPNIEILEQNYQKLARYTNEIAIYSASAKSKQIARFTFATIGSIKDYSLFKNFKTLIVDECHRMDAKGGGYKNLIDNIKFDRIIGLTATPYRNHATGDYNYITKQYSNYRNELRFLHKTKPSFFNDILYCYQPHDAFNDGYLSKLKYTEFKYDAKYLKSWSGDFSEESIIKSNEYNDTYKSIIEICKDVKAKHILIFATNIMEAEKISLILAKTSFRASFIHSQCNDRENKLKLFKSGEIKILVNVGILTTGYDFPELDCIILARPTNSLPLYLQMLGRGTRLAEGKDFCYIYDLCNNVKNFGKMEDIKIQNWQKDACITSNDIFLIKPMIYAKKEVKSDFTFTFGKYKNCKIKDIPDDYLEWVIKNFDNLEIKKACQDEIMNRVD